MASTTPVPSYCPPALPLPTASSSSFQPPVSMTAPGSGHGGITPPVGGLPMPSPNNIVGNLTPQAPPLAGGQLPGPPQLTNGIPDPGSIARQKDVYLKMLDDQLKQGINVLDQQVKYQRDYLTVQSEQQKKQFLLQLDQQMKAQEMVLTQQYNEQLMALQMQAGTQKAALEQQAMQLSMEYEQRKAEEHMYRQQYEIQQQQAEMAMKMSENYQRVASPQMASSGSRRDISYAPPPMGTCTASNAGCPSWAPRPALYSVGRLPQTHMMSQGFPGPTSYASAPIVR